MVHAQSPAPDTTAPAQDSTKVAAGIKGSYYHPDALPGLDCNVSVDWPAFLSQLKVNIPEDRLKEFQSLKIHSRAVRDQPASVDFAWDRSAPAGSDQIQEGMRQVVSGFYQMYWPMLAKSLIQQGSDITRSEVQPDGTLKVRSGSEGASVTLDLDKQMTPVHLNLDLTGMKADADIHYEDSPRPEPGDLRRLVRMDLKERIGTSNLNVNLKLTYQPLAEFFVPEKVSFEVVGAYSVNMEFSACTVISAPGQADPVK
jgi:hypothetical protein